MEIKGVIFDKDGVLLVSEVFARSKMAMGFRHVGYQLTDEFYNTLLGRTYPAVKARITAHFGSEEIYTEFRKVFKQLFDEGYRNGEVPLKPGAYELVNFLNEKKFPICLATSGSEESIHLGFDNSRFGKNPFANFICGEMVTRSKPDPEIFLKAAEKIAVPIEKCLIVEDSFSGIKAARRSGGISCMVPDLVQPDAELMNCIDLLKKDLWEVYDLLVPFTSVSVL